MKKLYSGILAFMILCLGTIASFATTDTHQAHKCNNYYGVSAEQPLAETCRWSSTVNPRVIEHWHVEHDSDYATASSQAYACKCDKDGNCDTCYTTESVSCNASTTCSNETKSCTASDGESCSVHCEVTSSYVDYTLRWEASGWTTIEEFHGHKCAVTPYPKTFERTESMEAH